MQIIPTFIEQSFLSTKTCLCHWQSSPIVLIDHDCGNFRSRLLIVVLLKAVLHTNQSTCLKLCGKIINLTILSCQQRCHRTHSKLKNQSHWTWKVFLSSFVLEWRETEWKFYEVVIFFCLVEWYLSLTANSLIEKFTNCVWSIVIKYINQL